jgi:hypothetical protein
MSARIAYIRRQAGIGMCAACRTHFRLLAPKHALCRDCYVWNRALTYIAAAQDALNDLPVGGRR